MPSQFAKIVQAVTDWGWPRDCFLCNGRILEPRPHCICMVCESALTTDDRPACPRCSTTIGPHVDASGGCPACRTSRFRFDGVVRLGEYDGLLREAILKAKQPGGDGLAEALGRVFADARGPALLASRPEVIVPVPLHWRRWWGRGHNQAEGIALGLGEALGVPVRRRAVWRVKGISQRLASRQQRWDNVAEAFRTWPWAGVTGVRVLLVDDVLTTGATADAAAAALRKAGAAQVHVAALAHR
ncbi:MAG: hypothetical protein MUF18_09525 [Fimbriiglobus sp.]|nr:hypothetical protein [Fimbriiglobus sp.]